MHKSYSLPEFYAGRVTDSEGRSIDEIWSWDYETLERVHNYIQWLFPLKERSAFNPEAPLLDDKTIEEFKTRPDLRARFVKSLELMLRFYGLRLIEQKDSIQVVKAKEYLQRKHNWITRWNHNYLRLTRILLSLRQLDFHPHCIALFGCLELIFAEEREKIGNTTYSYWRGAALREDTLVK